MKNIITLLFSIVSISAVAQNLAWTVTLVPVSFQLETSNGLPCRLEVNTEVPLRLKLETVNMIRYGYGWYMNEITPNEPTFTVNGIANGNSSVGQIVVEADRQVIFKAPLQKPGKNPVEVMASYNGLSVNGRIFDTSIICRIEMFGENSLRLAPDTAKLLVWSQLPLQIFRDSSGRSYEVGQLLGRDGSPKQPEWTVNGIPNGNYSVGMLSMDPLHTASFLSPSVLPDKNPVEIIANFREVYLNGQYADRKLVAHVEIIEGEWTINMDPEYELLAVNSKLPYQAFVQYKSLNPEVHGAQQPVYGWGWNFGSFTPNPPEWTVNGIPDGNKLTGQIIMNVNAPYDVTFKAPAHRPTKNPVEIRATYKDVKISERVFDTTFTSFIEIIEGNVTDSKNNEGKNNDRSEGEGPKVSGSANYRQYPDRGETV